MTILAIAQSVALFLGVEKVRTGAWVSFADTVSGTDLPSTRELSVLAGVIAAAAVASLLPALRAYRLSLADGMVVRI